MLLQKSYSFSNREISQRKNRVRQMWQKVLIVAPPRQDEEGIALQIKPLSHLCKYIVGPVPLPVLRKVSEGQVIGHNHIRLFY